MHHRIVFLLILSLVPICAAPQAFAQTKVGPQFQVSIQTPGNARLPSAAALSDGGFVVAWTGADSSRAGVYAQRYSAAGVRIGNEFPVNTFTRNYQWYPAVAGLSDGGFVIVWHSFYSGGDPYGGGEVYGQRYNASGVRVGSEFHVNTFTKGDQGGQVVAALNGGSYVVAWTSRFEESSNDEGGIYGQRYSAAGPRLGGEFHVNSTTAFEQFFPSVAGLRYGGFVVAWESRTGPATFTIKCQLYNSAGAKIGGEFSVDPNAYLTAPVIASLGDGGFVVTWVSKDSSGLAVYGRRFTAAGAPIGARFRANTFATGDQSDQSVSGLAGGGFVITWSSVGQDGSGNGVFGQMFTSAGARAGSEFRVNTTTAQNQTSSSVIGLSNGRFVVFWASGDTSTRVYGQRFRQ